MYIQHMLSIGHVKYWSQMVVITDLERQGERCVVVLMGNLSRRRGDAKHLWQVSDRICVLPEGFFWTIELLLLSTTRSLTPCPVSLLWITNLRKVDFRANLMAKLDNELFKKHQDLSGIILAPIPSSLGGDCVSSDAYLTDLVSVTCVKVLNPLSVRAPWFFTGRKIKLQNWTLLCVQFCKVPPICFS